MTSPPRDVAAPPAWTAEQAIEALYAAQWSPMVRLATLLLRDQQVAEEVVQEAFIALHARWDSLTDPGAATGYLRTSVLNGGRSMLRRRRTESRHHTLLAPDRAAAEDVAARQADHGLVMAALRTLPRRQQEVLVLRYYGELSETEIAETLRISRGSVKSHAHRGMTALRQALADDPPPQEKR